MGPVVNGKHAANDYVISCEWHMVVDGQALAYCIMNAHQIAAARKDPRLTVLSSIHAHEAIPDAIADHHKAHGVARGMTLHGMLMALSVYHSNFEPRD